MRRGLSWVVAVLSLAVSGCSSKAAAPPQPTLGNGTIGAITASANGAAFSSPFDATPSPDGKTLYFTAINGADPVILTAAAQAGATPTALATGAPLVAPFGIAINSAGTQLYIADSDGTGNPTDDSGALFVLPVAGGTPTALSGTTGYGPRSLSLVSNTSGDTVYFTGVDPANGTPGLFSISAAGGTAAVVAEGGPFADPSGVAVNAQGTAFVVDTVATQSGTADLLQVSHGAVSTLVSSLSVGYPAGIALSQDESVALVSGLDPVLRTDIVYRIVLATGQVTSVSTGISQYQEPAGLHRAAGAEVYAWADSAAQTTGTVFVLTP